MASTLSLRHMSCSPSPIELCFKECMSYLSFSQTSSNSADFGPYYSTVIINDETCFCSQYNVNGAFVHGQQAFGPSSGGIASLQGRTNTVEGRFLFQSQTCEAEYAVTGGAAVLGVEYYPFFDLWWVILIVCLFACCCSCLCVRFCCCEKSQGGMTLSPPTTSPNQAAASTPETFESGNNGSFAQFHGSSGSYLFGVTAATPIGADQANMIPLPTAVPISADQDYEMIPTATTVTKPASNNERQVSIV